MIHTRRLSLAAALCTSLALTGCTTTSAGSPMPNDTMTASNEPDTTSTEPAKERPREINLDGKDPCGLIPQGDWPKFDIKHAGEPSVEPNLDSPHCYYSGAGEVTLVVSEGIEEWTGGNRNVDVEQAEPIDGFPTVTLANRADKRACYAAVDVADGQYLLTTATPNPDDPSKPKKCDLAYQLAESAMKTLVAS